MTAERHPSSPYPECMIFKGSEDESKIVYYSVTLEKPEGVTRGQLRYAIEEAIQSIPGQLGQGDPLFELDKDKVTVRRSGK